MQKITTELESKNDIIAQCEVRVNEANQEASKRDGTIEKLKQEIQDEFNKQKLIEKKGLTNVSHLLQQTQAPAITRSWFNSHPSWVAAFCS